MFLPTYSILCFISVFIDFPPYWEPYFPASLIIGNFLLDARHSEFYLGTGYIFYFSDYS
jgi:hypothetical protein